MAASKRLSRELSQISQEQDDEITLIVDEGSLYKSASGRVQLTTDRWTAIISGPPDTPYHGGRFQLRIEVPPQYPHVAPSVKAVTKIFHPNFHFRVCPLGPPRWASAGQTGEICLDILKTDWTPGWTLSTVCRRVACEAPG